MRKLLLTLMSVLLYTGMQAQLIDSDLLEVGLGYGISTQDDKGYGKAYLAVDYNNVGAMFHFGGNSRIGYGGEDKGQGFIGGSAYYRIRLDNGASIRPFFGVDLVEAWSKVDPTGGEFINPNPLPTQQFDGVESVDFIGGVFVNYKFFEVGISTKYELFIGFKLTP